MNDNGIKTRISKAANGFVFSYGVRGWNMDELAAEAGITKRTLYKYAVSKQKLVEETLIEHIAQVQEKLIDELNEAKDLKQGILRIANIYPQLVEKINSRAIRDIFIQYPEVEKSVIIKRKELTKELFEFIDKARNYGAIRKNFDSEIVLDAIQSLVLYHIKSNPQDLREKLEKSIDMMMYGFMGREVKQ